MDIETRVLIKRILGGCMRTQQGPEQSKGKQEYAEAAVTMERAVI